MRETNEDALPISSDSLLFLPEDAPWIQIQERVITVAGKPIEDLTRRDLALMLNDFSDEEQEAIRLYRRQKQLEESCAFQGIVGHRSWEDWYDLHSNATLAELVYFQDNIRSVAIRLKILEEKKIGNEIFEGIKKELLSFQSAFPDLTDSPEDGRVWSLYVTVIRNIARIPPTKQGMELLERFKEMTSIDIWQKPTVTTPAKQEQQPVVAVKQEEPQPPAVITQEQLRNGQKCQLGENRIREALINGATIEPGPLTAFLRHAIRAYMRNGRRHKYVAVSAIIRERKTQRKG